MRSKYVAAAKKQEKKMEEKKVSFGDVSIHSFALDLDIVPTEEDATSFDLHMRLGQEDTLEERSVWMNMRRKSPSLRRVLLPK